MANDTTPANYATAGAEGRQAIINRAREILASDGPSATYEYMASKGQRYAHLAGGVVNDDTFSGQAANDYMDAVAKAMCNGKTLPEELADQIKADFAKAYLDVLEAHINEEEYTEITAFMRWKHLSVRWMR